MRRTALFAAGFLAAGLVAGCSGGPKLAEVSGVVKVNGKPYPGAMVSFQPIGGPGNMNPGKGSMGMTDKDGKYVLYYEGSTKGAVVGKHAVRISTLPGKGVKEVQVTETGTPDGIILPHGEKSDLEYDPIPVEWNENSTKTYEVPSDGTDQANFDITGAKDPKKGK